MRFGLDSEMHDYLSACCDTNSKQQFKYRTKDYEERDKWFHLA